MVLPSKTFRTNVGRALFALTIAISALAVGSVHTPTLLVVCALALAATLVTWWRAEPFRPRPSATILIVAASCGVAWTALQLVPLPAGVVSALSPKAFDIWQRALLPMQGSRLSEMTLSLDPIATRIEVGRGVVYLLALVCALRIAMRKDGVTFLALTLVTTSLVAALAAVLHPTLGVRALYGVYAPGSGIDPSRVAPLLNPNHLAAYINIGISVALGLLLGSEMRFPKALVAAALVILISVQVYVGSRGGVGSMVLAIVLSAIGARAVRRTEGPVAGASALAATTCLVFAGIIVVLSASSKAITDLTDTDASKFDLFRHVFVPIREFAWTGMGRGAFESVFAAYRGGRGYVVFTHAENIVLQWAAEWGVPFAAAMFATLGFALRPSVVRARGVLAVGPWIAIVVVVVQNLVDFSSEVPGCLLALCVCAAIVSSGTGGTESRRLVERWSRPVAVVVVSIAIGIGALFCIDSARGLRVDEERATIGKLASSPDVARDQFMSALRGAMLRHPAEPYFPFAGSIRAVRVRDESVVPWVSKTLERAPIYPPARFVLARSLATRSPAQARYEYRTVIEQVPSLVHAVIGESLRLVGDFESAIDLVPFAFDAARPHEDETIAALELIGASIDERLPATRARLDSEISARNPRDLNVLVRNAERIVSDLENGPAAPWCDVARDACVRSANEAVDRIVQIAPDSSRGAIARARVLLASGEGRRGVTELLTACDQVDKRTLCFRTLAILAREASDDRVASEALTRLWRSGCDVRDDCVANAAFIAEQELLRGHVTTALSYYQKAHELSPEQDRFLVQIADTAERSQMFGEAVTALTELARRHPEEAHYAVSAARLRERGVNDAMKPSVFGN